MSRTRRLIDIETHRAVFTWVQSQLVAHGLLRGHTVAVDATTLEANAAMRSIVRRDTGAARVDGADVGDTTTVIETVIEATEQLERAGAPQRLEELIADKGYHSNRTLIDPEALDVRPYIAEPDRGRRCWRDLPEAQALVYANRRRLRGARGGRLRRQRAEYVERSFAHLYETGAMRRTHLRGHQNILKRLLVHAGAFNVGLIMRQLVGQGTPRGLRGRPGGLAGLITTLARLLAGRWAALPGTEPLSMPVPTHINDTLPVRSRRKSVTCTTDC